VPLSPGTIPAARELTGQVRAAVERLARGSD
jgi:hypothetical protein